MPCENPTNYEISAAVREKPIRGESGVQQPEIVALGEKVKPTMWFSKEAKLCLQMNYGLPVQLPVGCSGNLPGNFLLYA